MKAILKKAIISSSLILICVVSLAFSLSFSLKDSINVEGISSVSSGELIDSSVSLKGEPNDYEHQVAALINNYRVSNGLEPLAFDSTLIDVAKQRSSDMLDRNYFSHYTPEGTNVFNVLKGAGYSYRYAGENLAQCQPASIGSADAFLNAWINSASHNQNMLRAQYTKIGVGMVENGSRRVVTTVFSN